MIASERFRVVRTLAASALVATFGIPQTLVAEATDHLVSPSEMQRAAVEASTQREQNLNALKALFSTEKAQRALQSAHMDPRKVENAVSSLSDQELAQLAARANKAQGDFAAGSLSDRDLLVLLIAIAALILIIVAVR
jgi:hypothetical protein